MKSPHLAFYRHLTTHFCMNLSCRFLVYSQCIFSAIPPDLVFNRHLTTHFCMNLSCCFFVYSQCIFSAIPHHLEFYRHLTTHFHMNLTCCRFMVDSLRIFSAIPLLYCSLCTKTHPFSTAESTENFLQKING